MILVLATGLLAACARDISFPVPSQKVLPAGGDPPLSKPLLRMSDPDADGWILDGIAPAALGERTRWTHQRPRVRLWLDSTDAWRFRMDLQVVERIVKDVGPQTITITINGSVLDAPTYNAGGEYEYSHAVPPSFLKQGGPVEVALHVDPVWAVPGQGDRLGILLTAIGFEKAGPK